MAKDENDLGFGHFSTDETENDWRFRLYDGLENTADLEKILERLKGETTNEQIKSFD